MRVGSAQRGEIKEESVIFLLCLDELSWMLTAAAVDAIRVFSSVIFLLGRFRNGGFSLS